MSDALDPPEATEEWFRSAKLRSYKDAAYYGYGFAKAGQHVPIKEVFVTKPIPTYVCHKRVQALEIRSIGHYSTDANDKLRRQIIFADPAFKPIDVPGEMFARHTPMPGDYYVVYEDGYASFSPRKAFLEGYSLASEGNVLMERLNDLAQAGPGIAPSWLQNNDWAQQLARVAREAYVTINSMKQRIEQLHKELNPVGWGGDHLTSEKRTTPDEKADPDQA